MYKSLTFTLFSVHVCSSWFRSFLLTDTASSGRGDSWLTFLVGSWTSWFLDGGLIFRMKNDEKRFCSYMQLGIWRLLWFFAMRITLTLRIRDILRRFASDVWAKRVMEATMRACENSVRIHKWIHSKPRCHVNCTPRALSVMSLRCRPIPTGSTRKPHLYVPKAVALWWNWRIVGFLLAKDSLIKSSHASHPIAGRRPGAADGKRPGQRPGVTARVA